jgi:CDP-diacylglycerol--glycerol-3-phosphate 3-phosphatidyltransferase
MIANEILMHLTKHIPNLLSLLRIMLALALPFALNHCLQFWLLYVLTGITDAADGFIARKYGWVSKAGARLDSFADAVFFLMLILILWLDFRMVISGNLFWIVLLLSVKLVSVATGLVRFCKVLMLHTLANKCYGLIVFCAFPFLTLAVPALVIRLLFIVALLPAVEEMIILLICKCPDVNIKSLLIKQK